MYEWNKKWQLNIFMSSPQKETNDRMQSHVITKKCTYPEVRGDLWHLHPQTGTQVLDILQIILHGVGQVHQVVQVDGIIFSSFELQVKRLWLTYMKLP